MGTRGQQGLRAVCAFSLQKCSPEGKPIFIISCLVHCFPGLSYFCYFVRSGSWTGGDGAWVELSGKMHVLARLLAHLRKRTDDRIVLVSNYTQVCRFHF